MRRDTVQKEWEAEMRRETRGRERPRLRGYGIAVPVLQALAAEYLLKGLSLRENGRYLKTHDLHDLYEAMGPESKPLVASVEVSEIGTKLPEFLEAHRNDFVNWRYVVEGGGASTHHVVLDRTLEALIAAPNPPDGTNPPLPTKPAYAILSPLRRILATADHMTTPNQPTPMRLFDDFERTYYGPADPGEPFYKFLNRFNDPRAEQARALCNQWFPDYEHDAPEDEIARFLGNFCGKDDGNHYAAWFELLTHQILVRIGFDVTIEPKLELPGRELTPDFAVTWNGSRILVEATVVVPDNDPFAPSNFERDAQQNFTQLEIANFTARIARASGTLERHLKKREIEREFERILAKHDPNEVQSRIGRHGYGSLPTELISFGDWQLLVELWPLPPDKRASRKARVAGWPQARMHDSAVPNAKQKIKKKLKKYRQASSQLILAVNVHNLGGFDPEIDGHDVLFSKDGIWDTNRGSGRQGPLAVFFVTETNSYAVPNTPARLYVNPSLDPATLPQALLRLPSALGPDGSEYHEGESIASILGLD